MSNDENTWETAEVFTNDAKTFCIRVTQRRLPPRFSGQIPLVNYSWELQRMFDNRAVRFFPVSCQTKSGEVSIEPFDISEVQPVLDRALDWIRNARQQREDQVKEYLANRK